MNKPAVIRSKAVAAFKSEIDDLIAEAMLEWLIPGLAIVVVQDGEITLLHAFGFRDVEAGLPVTPKTQFMACSLTKSFTSTGLALLVDERRLDWNKPVREYIPEFRLRDPVASERITVLDFLCHRSGLPRHDWIHLPGDLSSSQMLNAMRYLKPSRDIRTTFQYQNLGYLVAGVVAERISGCDWDKFTRTRLTDPLNMNVSFTTEDLAAAADAAVPYTTDGNSRVRARLWPISVKPAGGINTSIEDFANWLRLHLNQGVFESRHIVSAELMRELQAPLILSAVSELPEVGDAHYGLGLESRYYRGERAVFHSGGWMGWSTLMTLLPDRGLGIAIFTNRNSSSVPELITNSIVDRVCGKHPEPWLDRFRGRRRKQVAQSEADRAARQSVKPSVNTTAQYDLADYDGEYEHPAYGRMSVSSANGQLQWKYRGTSATLIHRHLDTFELPESIEAVLPERLAFSFIRDPEGAFASVKAPFEPAVDDIVFTRVPSGDCAEPKRSQTNKVK